jgi:hypothetical protein
VLCGLAAVAARAAVVVATVMPLLAGCQKGLDVSALNRCGHAVEARAESNPEIAVTWSKIEPDRKDNIVTEVESATQLYVDVRSNKDATPVEHRPRPRKRAPTANSRKIRANLNTVQLAAVTW